jgi:Phage terminase, small subunit
MKPPKLTVIEPGATGPEPPRKLGLSGLQLWRNVQQHYRVDDAGGVEMLCQLCEAADTVADLQSAIDQDGSVIRTKHGPKSHPALRELLAARSFIVRTLQRLGLDVEPLRPQGGRPPGPKFGG